MPAAPVQAARDHAPTQTVARLLLLTDTAILDSGGSERFLRNLLGGLEAQRYRIDVVQLSAPLPAAAPAALRRDGIRLEHRPIDAVYGRRGRAVYRELRQRLLRGDYDIVQSQHEKSDLICALLPRGPARAIRVSNRRDSGFQKGPSLRAGFRALNHRFDWIVAPSSALLTQLAADEGVAAARTRCLPNGVDSARFRPCGAAQRAAGRHAAGFAENAFLFGCVARLVPLKRHQDLIAAFAMVADHHPDAGLVLVGGGPLDGALRAQAQAAGLGRRVHFLGERDDIEALLPLLDAGVSCSETEGMSNAILEAMSCGLPVIATAVGGSPEMVDNGVTGVLVAAHAPGQLASAMLALLLDRERSRAWGRQARERVELEFSLAAMVARFDQFYRSCRAPAP